MKKIERVVGYIDHDVAFYRVYYKSGKVFVYEQVEMPKTVKEFVDQSVFKIKYDCSRKELQFIYTIAE